MGTQGNLFDPDRIADPPPAQTGPQTMSVSRLNGLVKKLLDKELPSTIHLVGEISNLTQPASGHLYFTLKDADSEIRAVMWRSAATSLKFKPTDGMEVVATGQVDVYLPRGQYQFQVRRMEPLGAGALELAFRQLREKLQKEGLFDVEHKKALPRYPWRIGVVTSATGAAIRDILRTLKRRWPCASVIIDPVKVQGDGAAEEIAAAIRRLNRCAAGLGGIDVLIVGRGGGSLEDLWAFNEETVARAIHAGAIPIISAVGHEVDITIADLIADVRAPTPTAAAELAAPVRDEVLADLQDKQVRLLRTIQRHLDLADRHLDGLGRAQLLRDPVYFIRRNQQRLDEASIRLNHALQRRLDQARGQLDGTARTQFFRDPLYILRQLEQQLDAGRSRLQWALRRQLNEAIERLHNKNRALQSISPLTVISRQKEALNDRQYRLYRHISGHLRRIENRLGERGQSVRDQSPQPRLQAAQQHVEQQKNRLARAVRNRLHQERQRLDHGKRRLEATGYRKTLQRGYTITRTADGHIIKQADVVHPGQFIETETADGRFTSHVERRDDHPDKK